MKRREALRKASLLLGYSIAAPAVVGILNGCKPEPKIGIDPNWKPQFFKKDQLESIAAMVDTFIPKTDTPSASEVGVVEFLDQMVATVLEDKHKLVFSEGLKLVENLSGGKPFHTLSNSKREEVITALEKEQLPLKENVKPAEVFYTQLKGLIVNGYMLTETIATEHLAYDPVPGKYEGCIPLEQNGGVNWSLN